jgi:hypothetical protein
MISFQLIFASLSEQQGRPRNEAAAYGAEKEHVRSQESEP